MVRKYNNGKSINIKITSYSDAPPGSGLGSSSSLVVAALKCYERLLKIKLSKSTLAKLAYEIERIDCKIKGGSQDQYAAVFGGFNYIRFLKNEKVIVNSLKLKREKVNNLELFTALFYRSFKKFT